MAAATTQTQTLNSHINPTPKPPKPKPRLACFSFAAYAKALINHLRSLNIPILPGLTDEEFSNVESNFRFTFPPDLRSILREGLPVGTSFPNWRSSSPQQLHILLNLPFLSLSKNISLHNFWSDSWGPKPQSNTNALCLVKQLVNQAPVLVPIYRNCYIPASAYMAGNPVFYIDSEDVRILSFDVARFFQEVEFLEVGGVFKPFLKKNNPDDVPAWAATAARRIEFWTDVAERGRRVAERGVTCGWWSVESHAGLAGCLEEVFWRLRDGGWREEEVREMMMMDGRELDDANSKARSESEAQLSQRDREGGVVWHVRVLSFVLLSAGWSREDVLYSLDLQDGDDHEKSFLEFQYLN